ncbi:predicted protein [Chaetomium globosum CBS 148.51]|uniref:Uncharacterized protein n=1 Tax=Chaetomium globosum (strain ATCC 6205 / CBS 148.51 / DSM 1962 / NBRC 6347 / NRRL 1970) TaxID=306901 RepID=Q2GNR1_CHAGB|nr:uncharacterized protein CHGG_10393 [Chaetomium globosum CBS 148.51]EAQ83989.1 predicted protein [Chaetomium globosum CBS 148.51]
MAILSNDGHGKGGSHAEYREHKVLSMGFKAWLAINTLKARALGGQCWICSPRWGFTACRSSVKGPTALVDRITVGPPGAEPGWRWLGD